MLAHKSVQKLDETFESRDKRVVFASEEHPLELYIQEDYDTRVNVTFNRSEVKYFAYVYKDTLTKDFLVTIIIYF